MSGEKFITSSTEGADKEVTPAAARTLLGSSGRDFATVAEAEAATYTEPEHCSVTETGKVYIYDAASTATVDHDYVLSVAGAGRLVGVTSAIQTQLGTKVTGPASATDNAIARFDGTTGKVIQNSSVTMDDNGSIQMRGGGTTFINITPNASAPATTAYGAIFVGSQNQARYFQLASFGSTFSGARFGQTLAGTNELLSVASDRFTIGTLNAAPVYFGTANAARGIIDSTGKWGINTITPTAILHAKAATADSSAFVTKNEDSTGKLLESLRADGLKFHDGAIARPALTITTDTTLTVATRAFLLLNFAAAGGVVTLPASPEDGQEFHPENIGAFAVTLARNGKLINGAASNVSIGSQSNGYYKYDTASGSWWSFD